MKADETTKAPNPITSEELNEMFDNGEDVSEYFDWSKARRPNQEVRRVNVDFPLAPHALPPYTTPSSDSGPPDSSVCH